MYRIIKSTFDRLFALALLLVLSPLLALIGAWVALDSPGDALYRQVRVGKGHRLFVMYKFRTMRVGAFKSADLLRDDSLFIQRRDDPRLTRAGRFLRKTSLDELPQLYNILRGEMSFIGPRPFILKESNLLPTLGLERLSVLPGITGLAQIDGRSDASLPDRLACDLFYVRNRCFKLDLVIFFRTIHAVILSRGAC